MPDADSSVFSLSVLTATKGHASKKLVADVHGYPMKDPAHHLGISAGRLQHVSVEGLIGLRDLLSRIHPDQALVHGVPKDSTPGAAYQLLKAGEYRGLPQTIARTLDCLAYPEGLRLLMLDYDPEPQAPHQLASAGELITKLSTIWHVFSDVGWLATTSTSSAIRSKQTQEWLKPPEGMHVYLLVTGDIARWKELATVKLWLAGEGYCKLATPNRDTGVASILMRALIDLTVFSPERLDYVAGAQIKRAPFYQDRPAPELQSGCVLDLDRLPDVTDEERLAASALMTQARQRIAPEQRRVVREHIAREPVTVDDVEQEIDARLDRAERGELEADHPLYFDNGNVCTAGTLTAAYDDKRLADPLEPDYGQDQAACHWRKGDWRIVSWAHGVKRVFHLLTPEMSAPPLDDDAMDDLLHRVDEDASARYEDWIIGARGLPVSCQHNALKWLTAHGYGAQIALDTFKQSIRVNDATFTDDTTIEMVRLMEESEKVCWTQTHVHSAIVSLGNRQASSSLTTWLDSLTWDQKSRIWKFFTLTYGAEDSEYAAMCGQVLFLSAVARAYKPGCKADVCVTLIGNQGVGKSRGIENLVPDQSWYTDDLGGDLSDKKAGEGLLGKWLVEFAEFERINRSTIEGVKAFLSRRVDHYRPPYGKTPRDFPRQCIFIGTTNNPAPLQDLENRRFMPIVCQGLQQDIAADRDQLWAEAVHRYRAGESWWVTDETLLPVVKSHQEEARQHDEWEEILRESITVATQKITISEAAAYVRILADDLDKSRQTRLGLALKAIGFVRKRETSGARLWYYTRP